MQQSASYVNIKHLMFLEWMNDKFGGMQDGLGRKSGSREKIRTTQHFWNELFIYLDSRQRELPPASQHPAAGAVNCVGGHLCFTSIYSVPLLARRALRYQRGLRKHLQHFSLLRGSRDCSTSEQSEKPLEPNYDTSILKTQVDLLLRLHDIHL